jgi:prepilin-type N-terminal cleavage/methylation domain-containing protein
MRLTHKNASLQGFTLVEIMIIVAIIAMLAVLAVPSAMKARETAAKKTCIANLTAIAGAKERWAMESKKGPDEAPAEADLVGGDKYFKQKVVCPMGPDYQYNEVKNPPTCSLAATMGHSL